LLETGAGAAIEQWPALMFAEAKKDARQCYAKPRNNFERLILTCDFII